MRLDTATLLLGLGTSVPEFQAPQETVGRFVSRVLRECAEPARRDRILDFVDRVYSGGGIDTRHSVIADYAAAEPSAFAFFPANWALEPFPTTADRMRLYERASVDLAVDAAREALDEARVTPRDVTHLVVTTCTGFFAPGPDILLIERLGMRPGVQRTIIGFMGCYAGFNGMRVSDHIVRSDPEATVLQICVELCSLHFQKKVAADSIVAGSLFADGCSAVLYGSAARFAKGLAAIVQTGSFVERDSLDQMTWNIADHGFEMRLSVDVPRTLRSRAAGFVDRLLEGSGLTRGDVTGWAVHPGGSRILESLAEALELDPAQLADSSAVLRNFGNMSSGTIFFILRRVLRRPDCRGPLVALGFGPGLSVEGAVLSR